MSWNERINKALKLLDTAKELNDMAYVILDELQKDMASYSKKRRGENNGVGQN